MNEQHERFDYILQFDPNHPQTTSLLGRVKEAFRSQDLCVKQYELDPILLVGASEEDILLEAEHLHFWKERADNGIVEEFYADEHEKYARNKDGSLFLPCERSQLVGELIDQVQVPDEEFIETFSTEDCTPGRTESLVYVCSRLGALTFVGPLNEPEKRKRVWRDLLKSGFRIPSSSVRDYYGEGVAFYFAWLSFYLKWLMPPALLGGLFWYCGDRAESLTVDNDPYVPLFALAMIVWSFFYIKLWDRRTAELAFNWGTYYLEKRTDLRPSYYGDWRISEVTGEKEVHYPAWKRRCKYFASAAISLALVFVAFCGMICSLNLQGFIPAESRFGQKNFFHVAWLARLSQPGAILDPARGTVFTLIPVLAHSILIFVLNQRIYRPIAERLTALENHRTEVDFENSLILKRFLFEAFDCYIALFYLAFVEVDVLRLRSELVALFSADCIRRVLTESVIPLIVHFLKAKKEKKEYAETKKDDSLTEEQASSLLDDITSDPYEQFDDYLELVIQYGYVMLFCSAFPLAAVLALLTNIVESKSDSFKLSFITRRPNVMRRRDIGMWYNLQVAITWLSVITNVFIFGFSSEQMMQWFPSMFQHVQLIDPQTGQEVVEHVVGAGMGAYVTGYVFGIEHAVFVIGLIIVISISDVPEHIKRKMDARLYQQTIQLRENRKRRKLHRIEKLKT